MYVGKRVEAVSEDETMGGTITHQCQDGLLVILYDDKILMEELYPYELLFNQKKDKIGVHYIG